MKRGPRPTGLNEPKSVSYAHPQRDADCDRAQPVTEYDALLAKRWRLADRRRAGLARDMGTDRGISPQMRIKPRHHLSRNQGRLKNFQRWEMLSPSRQIPDAPRRSTGFAPNLAHFAVMAKLTAIGRASMRERSERAS